MRGLGRVGPIHQRCHHLSTSERPLDRVIGRVRTRLRATAMARSHLHPPSIIFTVNCLHVQCISRRSIDDHRLALPCAPPTGRLPTADARPPKGVPPGRQGRSRAPGSVVVAGGAPSPCHTPSSSKGHRPPSLVTTACDRDRNRPEAFEPRPSRRRTDAAGRAGSTRAVPCSHAPETAWRP